MALFQNYDQRIGAVEAFLNMYGISSLGEAGKICADAGIDVFSIVRGVQPICFDDACYAYLVGAAAALKSSAKTAGEIALILGEGLQSFCIPGSVSSERQIGLGHGKLASMILSEDVKCSASWLVTSRSPRPRALSVLPAVSIRRGKHLSVSFSTAWARTRQISSPVSTALPMSEHILTLRKISCILMTRRRIPPMSGQMCAAMARLSRGRGSPS